MFEVLFCIYDSINANLYTLSILQMRVEILIPQLYHIIIGNSVVNEIRRLMFVRQERDDSVERVHATFSVFPLMPSGMVS